MNDNQKIQLARKYFVEQKISEIKIALLWVLGAAACVFAPQYIGKFVIYLFPRIASNANPDVLGIGQWAIGAVVCMIVIGLVSWILDNWKIAKKRAGLK